MKISLEATVYSETIIQNDWKMNLFYIRSRNAHLQASLENVLCRVYNLFVAADR